ncbi:oxalyl-CoA decarboxylase [Enterobacter cancerogenus]|uniref:oxalyl-CoA decarboxylase n=1 Tax=Enterobacter cancerogenus TaxID=69218 RepID=UPI000733EB82|nr:oxalyl-CoA decarboxylase [Enterobacter cancerogenus]KTQ49172.1 oxalyl-CoA decarboxylase [Enterobacter cancerogenus]KTQ51437.1 oxalyl-CoA decarboxylase [Enterobacter cancerogenus]KTQ69705.1 oxalyl-CoA decarboxylase [Enterobacter cancerogenus]KTQ79638.1 oxalyl-CoA decarboxylase [Enterobacter cancerogenus]MDT7012242.1 oxalyl-CoA decarboxylase [Enterobacter cancerogenus]
MSEEQELTDGMHIIVEALKQNNIDCIYGVAGIPITDMARHAQEEGIRYIGFRHEQSAGHAAAIRGYLTQTPGICLTVSAPGFMNGLAALANATVNGFPMIMISGSSDRAIVDLQQGDYEELDQMNAAKPYAKASYRVNKPEDLGIALARAMRAATSGRPGGVYLDLTAGVLSATLSVTEAQKSIVKLEQLAFRQQPDDVSILRAISLLEKAERPLVILGKGAAYSQADETIRNFIEGIQIPFLPMSMAKGLLEDTHPLSAAAARSFALENADVVMLVGARLNWLLGHGKKGWSEDVQFIQLDIEPQEIDSNRKIAAPVVGDISSGMEKMVSVLTQNPFSVPLAWRDILNVHKQVNTDKMQAKVNTVTAPLNYFNALGTIRDVLADYPDIYLVNEGANTLDNARNIIEMYKPRRRLDCGTWGVMGIGMGYAIGASTTTGNPVVTIQGDSAFGFSGMDIETVCRYGLPVTVIIFNNNGIYRGDGKDLSGKGDPSPTDLLRHARYDKLMDAFGGLGFNATNEEEIRHALTASIESRKPSIINVVIDPEVGTESGHITRLNPKHLASH